MFTKMYCTCTLYSTVLPIYLITNVGRVFGCKSPNIWKQTERKLLLMGDKLANCALVRILLHCSDATGSCLYTRTCPVCKCSKIAAVL